MKTKILLASALLASGNAMANEPMPEICNTAVNYAAQAISYDFSDGSFADKTDPKHIVLKKDFKNFPITKTRYLGSCEEDTSLPQAWCNVAGGSPVVYEVEVSRAEEVTGQDYPLAKMVVTYNRGGCWVDTIHRK